MSQKFIFVVTAAVIGCGGHAAPARPSPVPESAVWAGGPKGGAWIDCRPFAKEPHLQYDCTLYYESGNVWSKGAFIVREGRDVSYTYPSDAFLPPKIGRYEDYDGRFIYVRDGLVLVPRD